MAGYGITACLLRLKLPMDSVYAFGYFRLANIRKPVWVCALVGILLEYRGSCYIRHLKASLSPGRSFENACAYR